MIYTESIRSALQVSIEVHEVSQQQKRKGKSIPYITHPLTVGLILARSGANEETIVAGILHDTIEDSTNVLPVTTETLTARFGSSVATLVDSVTESCKEQVWHDRKNQALKRVATYPHESVLIKSADVISNDWELLDDFHKEGNSVFDRFNVSKADRLLQQHRMIEALLQQWPESPLAGDLRAVSIALRRHIAGPGPVPAGDFTARNRT